MAIRTRDIRGSRRLGLLLLAVIALPALTLVVLGIELLAQDRALMTQRTLERRQSAIQTVARALEQSLTEVERLQSGGALPPGAVRVQFSGDGARVEPRESVLWVPVQPAMTAPAEALFLEAEREEFQGDLARAAAQYERLAGSSDPNVRAGAFLRVARVARKERRWDAALAHYRALASNQNISIAGLPADLVARRASLDVMAEAGLEYERRAAAESLESDFLSSRWALNRVAWDVTAADLERALGRPLVAPAARRTLSLALDRLAIDRGQPDTHPSRALLSVEGQWVLVLRQSAPADRAIIVPSSVVADWADKGVSTTAIITGPIDLLTASGDTFLGPPVESNALKLSSIDAGLPWSLALNPSSAPVETETIAGRRALLMTGLVAILLLFGGGSYFLWRVVQRELDIARLQTDFVAAVSHEFRTPLTSLRHVTELLSENDDLTRERRQTFYETLERNTVRLQRLVESLLDFARMESGRKPFQRERVDAAALLTRIVADFSADVAPRGIAVRLQMDPTSSSMVMADAASLTTSIWNLLDNAVKYSVEGGDIAVSLARRGDVVAIAVRDHGIGIPPREQQQIFERFVRGRQATALGIKGTGLGLAMVSHVVRAHDGTVELESAEGAGSTFTIVLPHDGASLEGRG